MQGNSQDVVEREVPDIILVPRYLSPQLFNPISVEREFCSFKGADDRFPTPLVDDSLVLVKEAVTLFESALDALVARVL